MKIIRLVCLLSIILTSCIVSSCWKKNRENNKITLNLNITQDPITFDPRKGSDFASSTLLFLMYEGLVRVSACCDEISLAIAEKVELSEDMTKYTFHLKDAKWSNGSNITAFDFIQTWKDMLKPNFPCPNVHMLYSIKNAERAKLGQVSDSEIGLTAIDYKTLEICLERPTPFFLEMISFSLFSPINQLLASANSNWADSRNNVLVTNGPYRLSKYIKGREIILEKNPYYWDSKNVKLEKINFSIVGNELTVLNMFDLGEIDILGLPFTGIPPDSIPHLINNGEIKTSHMPASTICCFNMSNFPFTNINIRKAFAYAINRQEIVDNITQKGESIGTNLIPQALSNSQVHAFFKDNDKEKAKMYFEKGLKELGITKDELGTITLLYASTDIYPKIAQALQDQWKKSLGVDIQLTGHEYKIFLDKLTKKDYQLAQCIWVAQYPDPMNFFERFTNKNNLKNYPGYENKNYNAILDRSITCSKKELRFKVLNEAEQMLIDEMPLTAIYHWNNAYMQKPYVKNLLINKNGFFCLNSIEFSDCNKKKTINE